MDHLGEIMKNDMKITTYTIATLAIVTAITTLAITTLAIVALAGCAAAPPTSTIAEESSSTVCYYPHGISCWPQEPGIDSTCQKKCLDPVAYCPPYSDQEWAYCAAHPGHLQYWCGDPFATWEPCDYLGTPCTLHQCTLGSPP